MCMKTLKDLFIFILGAVGYGGIEILWRGKTHWTMLLLGGVCLLVIDLITRRQTVPSPLRPVLCAAAITVLEFCCGLAVNLRLGWSVWDYSDLPGNLLGQVCPQYALLWLALSIPCSALTDCIEKHLFAELV